MIDRGHAIQVAWKRLRAHAEGCELCLPGWEESALARVPEDPSDADLEVHVLLCEAGRELHAAWVAGRGEWLEGTREFRRRLGVLGAAHGAVVLRDAAWVRVPERDRRRLLTEATDAERDRTLEAIEAGIIAERRGAGHQTRRCELCEKPFASGGRYCSAACRTKANHHLESTE